MEIKINIEKPNWSKKKWYTIIGITLGLIIIVSFLFYSSSLIEEAKELAKVHVKDEIAYLYGEEIVASTDFQIDTLEKRDEDETADEVFYDVRGTLTHPHVDRSTGEINEDETVTEYIYFYLIYNKIQKEWHPSSIQPDRSRE